MDDRHLRMDPNVQMSHAHHRFQELSVLRDMNETTAVVPSGTVIKMEQLQLYTVRTYDI